MNARRDPMKARILVIDDEAAIRDSMRMILEYEGYEFLGAATGETDRWQWDPGGLAALVYLALFGSAVAYSAYTWLLKRVPADRVATYAYVNPAVAAALGWAVLGEALTLPQVAGMLVVLVGVALVTLQGK